MTAKLYTEGKPGHFALNMLKKGQKVLIVTREGEPKLATITATKLGWPYPIYTFEYQQTPSLKATTTSEECLSVVCLPPDVLKEYYKAKFIPQGIKRSGINRIMQP